MYGSAVDRRQKQRRLRPSRQVHLKQVMKTVYEDPKGPNQMA